MQDRLFRILFGAFAAIVLATAVTTGAVIMGLSGGSAATRQVDGLTARARVLGEMCGGQGFRGPATVADQVRAAGQASGTRFTLVSTSGVALVDSQAEATQMTNQFDHAEILEARARTVGTVINGHDSNGVPTVAAAVAVRDQGVTVGFVRAEEPRSGRSESGATLWGVLAGVVAAALLTMISWAAISRGLTEDLDVLDRTVQALLAHSDWRSRR